MLLVNAKGVRTIRAVHGTGVIRRGCSGRDYTTSDNEDGKARFEKALQGWKSGAGVFAPGKF